MAVPDIAVRSGRGVLLLEGPESYRERKYPNDASTTCRAMAFSPKGDYFAWTNGTSVEIAKTDGKTWSTMCSIPQPKTLELQFSPTGKYIVCWELYTVNQDKEGSPNMSLYTAETGALIQSFVQIKQSCWQPAWSIDEKLFGRIVNNEVLLYENLDFTKPSAIVNCSKVAAFSLSPTTSQRSFVACYMPGSAGQPSFQKLFQYPKFEMSQAVASKTFFQGESVTFYWNDRGTSVLSMTSSETDKTGTTYYGRQSLHFANVKGETSMVQLGKEGPIYDVAWSPKGLEFCVVYGIMPAKATLYNMKCDPVFEFGTAPRNSIYFSPNGNRLLLGGFGNLPGRLEVWDMETKKQITTCDAPNSTGIIWDPRSECFLSFTTAPRLRTDNGYKVWHCSGTLMHEYEWKTGELYEVLWQPGNFPPSALANKKPKAAAPSKPPLSKTPYRPPAARGQESSFKVHDEDEKPHLPGQLNNDGPSKAALKQKKKREARKAKKAEQVATTAVVTVTGTTSEPDGSDDEISKKPPGGRTYEQKMRAPVTNDPDKDKKIKNIIKKLEAIAKLKSDIAAGKTLDVNQTAKIAKENDLLKELGELNL